MTKLPRLLIVALATLSAGLGYALYAEHQRSRVLAEIATIMTLEDGSILSKRAADIHKVETGASLEQSREMFYKQLFYLGDHPCVAYVPKPGAFGSRATYCFNDEQGTKLLYKQQ